LRDTSGTVARDNPGTFEWDKLKQAARDKRGTNRPFLERPGRGLAGDNVIRSRNGSAKTVAMVTKMS
jgi:hypothetical protein